MSAKKIVVCKALILAALLAAYVYVVLHNTILNRAPVFEGVFEIHPMASYRRAARAPWHLARLEIRNLILNTAMFMPLGTLVPALYHRLAKFYIALPIALAATIAIEIAQFVTARGVFAVEDILHNMAGAAIGYALYKIFWHKLQKRLD